MSETMADDALLTLREVLDIAKLSKATIYRKMADGTFPRPRRVSKGSVAWYYSEVDAWRKSLPVA